MEPCSYPTHLRFQDEPSGPIPGWKPELEGEGQKEAECGRGAPIWHIWRCNHWQSPVPLQVGQTSYAATAPIAWERALNAQLAALSRVPEKEERRLRNR